MATVRPSGLPEYRLVAEGGAGQAEVEMGGGGEREHTIYLKGCENLKLGADLTQWKMLHWHHNKSVKHTGEVKAYYKQ